MKELGKLEKREKLLRINEGDMGMELERFGGERTSNTTS